MTDKDEDIRAVLEQAMTMIALQGQELEAQRRLLGNALELQRQQADELENVSAQIGNLERMLHESDEGLSEALIVLANMRAGVDRVSRATSQTVSQLAEIGYSPDVTDSVKGLSSAVTDLADTELLDAHEAYLRDLRKRLGKG